MVKDVGSTLCSTISQSSGQKLTLNPFDNRVTECFGDGSFSANEQSKLDFLCIPVEVEEVDIFMFAILCTLAFGGLCCITSFCVFCKYRAKSFNQIEEAGMYGDRVHDPLAAQRILEQQNKMRLKFIEKMLPKKKFSQSAHTDNQESCVICCEDFQKNTPIRETPCHHIFHDHCVMKWVETKLDNPDCPYCRTEIKMNN